MLGKDELAVADHVELPVAARERRCRNPARVQLGRETRGPLVVAVSGGAVVDLDGHGGSLAVVFAAEAASASRLPTASNVDFSVTPEERSLCAVPDGGRGDRFSDRLP